MTKLSVWVFLRQCATCNEIHSKKCMIHGSNCTGKTRGCESTWANRHPYKPRSVDANWDIDKLEAKYQELTKSDS